MRIGRVRVGTGMLVSLQLLLGGACWLIQGYEYVECEQVALVIGNSNYPAGSDLKNPLNDADAVASALRGLGFLVLSYQNLDSVGMRSSLEKFADALRATPDSLAFFFFAGHGIQSGGINYLVPAGMELESETELSECSISAKEVLEVMDRAGTPTKVLVLDCCRDNPFTRSLGRRQNATRGLAAIPPAKGTIISFSTAPGRVASDGSGPNSPFTEALAQVLWSRPKQGLEIVDVFRQVSPAVIAKTKDGQRPWIEMDAAIRYYLVQPETGRLPDGGIARAEMETPLTPPKDLMPVSAIRPYQVVYAGTEGVGVRKEPGSNGSKLAAAFPQTAMPLWTKGENCGVHGVNWMKLKIDGWIAAASRSGKRLLKPKTARILDRNPSAFVVEQTQDGYVSMRTGPSIDHPEVARVFPGTQVERIERKTVGEQEWILVTFDGWVAEVSSDSVSPLVSPFGKAPEIAP